jgi:predicted acetyltransferase
VGVPDLELRTVESQADEESYSDCVGAAFGTRMPQDVFDADVAAIGRDHMLAALEEGVVVGTAAWFPLELTLPGGGLASGVGITSVTTRPTHRRRGVLTGLMKRMLAEHAESGFACSLLNASEGGIYGRFGYGVGTYKCRYTLDKRLVRLRPEAEAIRAGDIDGSGRVRIVSRDEAAKVFPEVWERARLLRPGEVSYPDAFWAMHFRSPSPPWAGIDDDKRFFAFYEEDGDVLGYVDYQVASRPEHRVVDLDLLVATTRSAYFALWRYLIGIDLTPVLETRQRPVNEPIRHLLSDARQLQMSSFQDALWVRPLDLVRLLEARRYSPGVAGQLSLAVRDSVLPQLEGVYTIEADGVGAASVTRAGADSGGAASADLDLDVAEVGSVLLGGTSFVALREAGLVAENTPGAAWRADALFAADVPPFLTLGF